MAYQLQAFRPPADQQDLPTPELQAAFNALWSVNVDGFVQQAIVGDPWNATYQSNQTSYYNELHAQIPASAAPQLIFWDAFPNRLRQYFGQGSSPKNPSNFTVDQLRELADTGYLRGASFPQIPTVRCPQPDWSGPLENYGPYGPRGWQDEYCEWSVTRDEAGKIVRVDFTSENPEYWYTLWRVSPDTVAAIYEETLNFQSPTTRQISVTVADLVLYDPVTGAPVIDPSTGDPAYNPFNKWNTGPVSVRSGPATSFTGGAMHLTATPNTVQTEIALGAGASVLRKGGNNDPQALICCGQYGQNFRNSDPHIGQLDNKVVALGNQIAISDPVALYMQMPDFGGYALPSDPNLPRGAQPSDCWHVVRGVTTMTDPVTGGDYPGQMLLHGVFQLPLSWIEAGVSFTVSDVAINGEPIAWAAQIAETMNIGSFVRPLPSRVPSQQPCVGTPSTVLAAPEQMMYQDLWNAYYGTDVANPVGQPMSAASNTVIIPPIIEQGTTEASLVLICASATKGPNGELPSVIFPPGDVKATVVSMSNVSYAVPGNSYPSVSQALTLSVTVADQAQLGLRAVQVANYGQTFGEPAPAFLHVVPVG